MRYLLDTHAFLWFLIDSSDLSVAAKAIIEDDQNAILLSIGSIWEMAIKKSLGKLDIPDPFDEFLSRQIVENNIKLLEASFEHVSLVAKLPFHHRDPFDRLLIAQALTEQIPLIGRDTVFDDYGVVRRW